LILISFFDFSNHGFQINLARVHPFANKHLKSLLNMAAMGAIPLNGEYKTIINGEHGRVKQNEYAQYYPE